MKKKFKKLIKFLTPALIIVGAMLFFFNAFNFSATFKDPSLYNIWTVSSTPPALPTIEYYYSLNSLWLISIGVGLFVLGLFLYKNNSNNK